MACVLVVGCAATSAPESADPQLRQAAAKIAIVGSDQVQDRAYSNIGHISRETCIQGGEVDAASRIAQYELQLDAARLAADAILDVSCSEAGHDEKRNCWRIVRCSGIAVRWDAP